MLIARHRNNTSLPNRKRRLIKLTHPEWLGQTIASLGWIASVLIDGISSGGDWLQLIAASAWLLSNMAALSAVPTSNHSSEKRPAK